MADVLPTVDTDAPQRLKGVGRPARRMWSAAYAQTEFKIGLALLLLLAAASIIYPLTVTFSATTMNVTAKFLPPVFMEGGSWAHPLGTDQLGRDLMLRALVGLKNALSISLSAVAMTLIIGATIGMLAGYYGRWTDTVLMRLTDAQLAIPLIILAVTILTARRPTPLLVILVLGLSSWPAYARIIRSVMLGERRREYVRGAKILGASDFRVIFLLIAPNILPPVLFVAILEIARMMIFEAILGFIGIGVQPPTPTFGNIIADGRSYLINAWWIATMPGAFLFATLLAINLIGACVERPRDMLLRGSI
jgi:peptide/nickel transport system permease protein